MFSGEGSVEGIINFGGGTTATSASTMNSFDKITGSSSATDSLDVTLINASGAPIGAGAEGEAQVNKLSIQSVTADVAQVNRYTFDSAASDATLTFTYGGNNGSFAYSASAAPTTAANFASALNAVAGSTIAATNSVATTGTAVTTAAKALTVASTTGLMVGQSVTGTGIAAETFISAIDTANKVVTLSVDVTANITAGAITFGTNQVLVTAPVAGTPTPSISFSSAANLTQALVTPNVAGNQGDLVSFTYNGLTGTYAIGSSIDATAANLKNALTATIPTSQADAELVVLSGDNNDYVTLTSATKGVPLASLTFSGSAGNTPITTTLTANVAASGAISFGTTTDVEILNLTNDSGSTATVSQNAIKSATQLWSDNSANAVAWTDVGKTTALGIRGDGTALAEGAVTGTYVAGTTAATLVVSNANAGAVVINGNADGALVTQNVSSINGAQTAAAGTPNSLASLTLAASTATLNIDAATSLTTGAITATGLTRINASGAATNVNIGTAPASVTTINGSGLTAGGITTQLTAAVTSFVGGAGVDTVTVAGATNARAAIDGGAGTGDILDLAANNDVTTAAKAAQYTNFEILRNSQAATAVNMNLFGGYTGVQSSASGAGFNNMTAQQAANVLNRIDNTGATYALANATGTSDAITITLNNGTATPAAVRATSSADLIDANVNGFETVNIVSRSGSSADASALSFAGANAMSALNISGTAPINMTDTDNLSATTAVNINASGLVFAPTTGNFAFQIAGGLLKGSSVTGTASADQFTTATTLIAGSAGEYVTYTGGGGNDRFVSTFAAINNTNAAGASLKLDAGAGRDTLRVTDATAVDANFQYLSGFEVLDIGTTGAGAVAAGVNVTTGGFFNAAFAEGLTLNAFNSGATNGVAINLSTYASNTVVAVNTALASTGALTISTGLGNDTITVTANALTTAVGTINLGAGNDALTYSATGAARSANTTIISGIGQDIVTLILDADEGDHAVLSFDAGHTAITAYDSVNGAIMEDAVTGGKGTLFTFTSGTTAVVNDFAAVAVAGYTTGELTISAGAAAGTGDAGVVAFAGTKAATLTVAEALAAMQVTFTAAGSTVVWQAGNTNYYLFNAGATTSTVDDSVVELVGVTGTLDLLGITGAGSVFLDT